MNRTLLSVAALCLMAGGLCFLLYLQRFQEEGTGGSPRQIVVAAQHLNFGTTLRPELLALESIGEHYVEHRHIAAHEAQRIVGLRLSQSVRSGEAILRTDLSALSREYRALSGSVPQGQRALSLRVRAESTFSGLIRPGDRVDVILSVGHFTDPDSRQVGMLAQNLLVLSVGQEMRPNPSDPARRHSPVERQVSLQVDREDAQRITLAATQGRMQLLLRNPNDLRIEAGVEVIRQEQIGDRQRREQWSHRSRQPLTERPDQRDPSSPPVQRAVTAPNIP